MIELANLLLAEYNLVPPVELFTLPAAGSNNRTLGVRTGGGEFVWKSYRSHIELASILYEHRLLKWLAERELSFAIPVPVLTRTGKTVSDTPQGWQALFVRLPGMHPDPQNLDQLQAIGAALGELHHALSVYTTEPRPGMSPFGDLCQLDPRIPDPFTLAVEQLGLPDGSPYDPLVSWWRDEMAALRPFLEGVYRKLPWQVVHRDFDPSNTLVHQAAVTAVLDLEFAAPDVRALDVASGLKFTMRVWQNEGPWDIARAFCRGYARWIQLTTLEVEALPWLIRLRDAVSTTIKIGRALAADSARLPLERISSMQVSTRWLEAHKHQLIDVVGHETHCC